MRIRALTILALSFILAGSLHAFAEPVNPQGSNVGAPVSVDIPVTPAQTFVAADGKTYLTSPWNGLIPFDSLQQGWVPPGTGVFQFTPNNVPFRVGTVPQRPNGRGTNPIPFNAGPGAFRPPSITTVGGVAWYSPFNANGTVKPDGGLINTIPRRYPGPFFMDGNGNLFTQTPHGVVFIVNVLADQQIQQGAPLYQVLPQNGVNILRQIGVFH